MRRLYFDNAATSWPKRPAVVEAVAEAFELGASYGRGQSRSAGEVRSRVDGVRRSVAELCGVSDPSRVVLTSGGTEGLNLAIRGLLPPGGRAVTTGVEHNSVTRPLAAADAVVRKIPCDGEGRADVDAGRRVIDDGPLELLVLTHASNVTGAVQPVAELAAAAHDAGGVVVVDACQTAGWGAIDCGSLGADVVVASGHKKLGGPLGTGFVAFADVLERLPQPLHFGGTGSAGASDRQPDSLPERYESGSLNVPGLFGLAAALAGDSDATAADAAARRIARWVVDCPSTSLVGPTPDGVRTPVVSFTAAGWQPTDLALVLESEFGVECRAGLHCSPDAHDALGTRDGGGTVRLSPSSATTDEEVTALLAGLDAVLG